MSKVLKECAAENILRRVQTKHAIRLGDSLVVSLPNSFCRANAVKRFGLIVLLEYKDRVVIMNADEYARKPRGKLIGGARPYDYIEGRLI